MDPVREWLAQPGGLADQLREIREATGLSGNQFADQLGWPQSKVSRLERGVIRPSSVEDLHHWAQTAGADLAARERLLGLYDEMRTFYRGFVKSLRQGQVAVQLTYNERVARSSTIAYFETAFIPGLLQTAAYARRVFTEVRELADAAVDDVEQAVATRMERQRFLADTSKRFEFLLLEPVLLYRVADDATMRAQLDRLHSVIGVPHIRFGIIPLDRPLATIPQNAFQLYDDEGITEGFTGEAFHEPKESARLEQALERLWQDAVEGEDARALIVRASERLAL